MKKIILLVCLSLAPAPALFLSSCAAPSTRVQEVKTLKAVGLAVDGTMKLAAQLYHDGKITAATWNQVAAIHDQQFLPAFNAAVSAVQMNLDSLAGPDVVTLAAQLTSVLAPYLPKS